MTDLTDKIAALPELDPEVPPLYWIEDQLRHRRQGGDEFGAEKAREEVDGLVARIEQLEARLAEAEALLHRAAEYVRGFEDAGCGEGECPECQMARIERDIKDYFTSVGG